MEREESTTKIEIEDTTMDKRIKKLIRSKESRVIATNTIETKSKQEKEIKELKQLLTGAREVILNLEDECGELHKKAEFYEDMSENLVTENENMIVKMKQISEQTQKLHDHIGLQKWKLNNYTVKYDCEICGELLIKKNEIEEHKEIHEEAMQFDVNVNVNVTRQTNLQEKTESIKARYNCDTCGELFFKEN